MHDTVYPMLASSLGGLHNNPDRELPERTGNRHTGMAVAPYNIYDTSDGWLAIICMSERHWRGLATAMGRPELIDDPRFRTAKDRVANIDAVDEEVSSHTRARTRGELVRDLQAAGVPCAPVKSIREVDTDEHLIERGMIRYVEHAARGRVPVPGSPAAGSATRRWDRCAPPRRWASRPRRSSRSSPATKIPQTKPARSPSMSFTPEAGTPLAAYYAETQPRTGAVLARRSLGTLDAVTIGRYAMTIGAADPSHYDAGGCAVGGLRRRRGSAEPARRDGRMGCRHPRDRARVRRNAPRR